MDEEAVKLINERLDIIEDKLARLNSDLFQLNEFFRLNLKKIPVGHIIIDSTGSD